jgi:hypothetical protein
MSWRRLSRSTSSARTAARRSTGCSPAWRASSRKVRPQASEGEAQHEPFCLSASWGAGIQQGSCTINGVSAEPKDRQRQQYDELGRQVEEDFDWRFIPMTVIMITAFWGMVGLVWLGSTTIYRVLFLHVHGVPVYLAVTIAASCFFLAAIVCTLRDLRNWRSVAWFQILISIAGGGSRHLLEVTFRPAESWDLLLRYSPERLDLKGFTKSVRQNRKRLSHEQACPFLIRTDHTYPHHLRRR